METMDTRNSELIQKAGLEFNRLKHILNSDVAMDTIILDNVLWITFRNDKTNKAVRIPLPHNSECGIELLTNNDVTRVVCDYWLEKEHKRLKYHDIIEVLLCEDINRVMPHLKSGASFISKIIRGFQQDTAVYMITVLQRLINEVVNNMPIHETDMNSWAMNYRLMVIDPAFHGGDPNYKLDYRVALNDKYYALYGWTLSGLSDGVLADKNVILTTDLRKYTPFGWHHNPQRNLYSTLSMKGDELPKIRTESMQQLIEKGITRKGWNLVTAVLDTPLTFEDQILVDKRHLSLSHKVEKRYVVYGDILFVKEGDTVETGDLLGTSGDGDNTIMRMRCDSAVIKRIKKTQTDVGGEPVDVIIITVEGTRFLREGSKFSNMHGNKGIVKFVDLGYAVDPRTGNEVPIDVMVSAKSVNKRANFGQLVEAFTNNMMDDSIEYFVMPDEYTLSVEKLKTQLKADGFPEDGVWAINTYCGEFEAVVGKMFWGVTKDPEDQLWEEDKPNLTNNKELRTSGLKFSHVEMKAITTWFGPGNPICAEILSHAQGGLNLRDEIRIIKSACGEVDENFPLVKASDLKCVDASKGIFHTLEEITGTVVDDTCMPDGFIMQLPVQIQAIVQKDDRNNYVIGIPQAVEDLENKEVYLIDRVFVPNSMLRRCWRHPSGKWGLSTIGAYVNRIVSCVHSFSATENNVDAYIEIARAVSNYFSNVAHMMGTKNGDLSTYGMSIRYIHSSRATASLSDELLENTVEIHVDMARMLGVRSGDVVLAERFPCLGFVSVRPQWVNVTDDPQCKYVIRVSGNSLVSQNLDFDGDTLFLAAFKTPKAIEALRNAMENPNPVCYQEIQRINANKVPVYKEMYLDDFDIKAFPKPTVEEHSDIIRKATGVKSHTGPVIALAYNLMRIVEANISYKDIKQHVALELLLDFLGNTVFKQKHGIKSLQEDATDAICTGDVERMVELGFSREPSVLLCNLIRKEALSIGVRDLVSYHKFIKEKGGSKIINKIVRVKNKLWFASRAMMGPYKLREHLKENAVDLPSLMLQYILRKAERNTSALLELQDYMRALRKLDRNSYLATGTSKDVRDVMFKYIDTICGVDKEITIGIPEPKLTGIGVVS